MNASPRVRSTLSRLRTQLLHLACSAVGDDVSGRWVRRRLLRAAGARVAATASIHGGTYISCPAHLQVGADVLINRNCYLDLEGSIVIERDVVIGHGVSLVTAVHEIGSHERRAGSVDAAPVVIRAGAWLGANCTILPGVTVGEGAVVAAGAVVTHDVAPDDLVGGVPARVLRHLDDAGAAGHDDRALLAGRHLVPVPRRGRGDVTTRIVQAGDRATAEPTRLPASQRRNNRDTQSS